MQKDKYIVLDIDGTLTYKSSQISTYTFEVLTKLSKKYKIIFCSGRNWTMYCEIMNNNIIGDYMIGSDGSFIKNIKTAKILSTNLIDSKDFAILSQAHSLYKDFKWEVSTLNTFYYLEDNQDLSLDTLKIDVYPIKKPIDSLYNYLQGKLKYTDVYKMTDSLGDCIWLVVTTLSRSKASALSSLAKTLRIDKKELIYCGDSYTDIEAMKMCGTKVCPCSAVKEVLAIADIITEDNTLDGVSHYLETLC